MLQNFTLHTHTNEFDGKNTVAEMANAATEKNMKTIGIEELKHIRKIECLQILLANKLLFEPLKENLKEVKI